MNDIDPDTLFGRSELLLGRAVMERLAACRVILFGVGGVGSWCAEALVRTGVGHVTLVDSDLVSATNVNRQVQATALSLGQVKTDALRRRLLEIHPRADVLALRVAFEEQTCDQFDLAGYDYVVDAIDSLKNKVLLIERCVRLGVKLYSSMGAAARLDPAQIRVGTLVQTSVCPLARAVRQGLRERHVPLEGVTCVYSLEPALAPATSEESPTAAIQPADEAGGKPGAFPDWNRLKAQVNGTVVHVTAVFGFSLAGLVVQDVAGLLKTSGADASRPAG